MDHSLVGFLPCLIKSSIDFFFNPEKSQTTNILNDYQSSDLQESMIDKERNCDYFGLPFTTKEPTYNPWMGVAGHSCTEGSTNTMLGCGKKLKEKGKIVLFNLRIN